MDDLISRKAAIEAIDKYNVLGYVEEPFEKLEKALQDVPSADGLTGTWVDDKCSICGAERAWYGCNPSYCPDCGARMERSK